MTIRYQTPHFLVAAVAGVAALAALAALAPAVARAQRYEDVSKSHWAYAAIASVTDRGPAAHKLLDDFGVRFKPEARITRAQFARALVIASGHFGDKVAAVPIADVAKDDPSYDVIQVALSRGYLSLDGAGRFLPDDPLPAYKAEAGIVRWLKDRHPGSDWGLLSALRPSRWEPNPGWSTKAPRYLPYVVASRQLLLRFNHSSAGDKHEVTPSQSIDRAEVAYMFWRGYKQGSEWNLSGLSGFGDISFPALSARQKQIVRFALKYIGYPYVWAGEYPTRNSPYGYQAAGGFDCSGFVFYVMKMHFGYPITVNERGAHDMAQRAKPRISRKNLKCGDLIFFGPNGTRSSVGSIYHTALYLGRGWFIHSTGSSDGVTLASLNGSSYWKNAFAWGRRLLKPAELVVEPPASAQP